MRTDNKEKVLLALYGVYNLDEPNFDQVNYRRMEMPLNAFNWALMKLETEKLVTGVKWLPPDETRPEKLLAIDRRHIMLTREGVELSDELLGTQKARQAEKLQKLYDFFKDVALPVAEIIAPALGL